jgi:hypothetical protein
MNKNAIVSAGKTQPMMGTKMDGKNEAAYEARIMVFNLLVVTTNH